MPLFDPKRKSLIEIGYLQKLHGIKGEVQLNLKDDIFINLIDTKGWIFIEINGEYIPFFVLSFFEKNLNTLVLSLEDIYTLEQAKGIIKNKVYVEIDENEKNKYLPKEEIFKSYIGYFGKTMKGTDIGELIEIKESPTNPLLVFIKNEQKILIPIYSDFIKEIDNSQKMISLDLPDNYLEVF